MPSASCSWARPEQVQALGNLKFDIATPDVQGFVEQFHARVPAGARCGSPPVPMMVKSRR
jgi:hypothetical protein